LVGLFLYVRPAFVITRAKRLKAMVGYRNIAGHDYQTLKLNILKQMIEKHLADFTNYTRFILKL
jgi:uncharacterized protein YutE (UPF0331/DUF86 family)